MSDNEGEQQPGAEGEPVPEPEEPRNFLKQEQIVEGLSLITRTAGKFSYVSQSQMFRWSFIRLQHSKP